MFIEDSELLKKMTEDYADPETAPEMYRECCWMVEKRGSVGETVFHICYLVNTTTHTFLGRRLLKWFPKLINDVYLSEEYYGENVLHMSVVGEDPTMVKYLLEQGVNIHERCSGAFFTPDDQKSSRTDNKNWENADVCIKTTYPGYVAWGEYPLTFAAVLSQEECYRLILAKGANHDLVDENGNSVTHIMVINNNMKMFDMAVDIDREVYWQIGNVCCSAYPIEELDSINPTTGELNTQSGLNLIVFGRLVEHIDLIEGVVVDLLQVKWKSFIKKIFLSTTPPLPSNMTGNTATLSSLSTTPSAFYNSTESSIFDEMGITTTRDENLTTETMAMTTTTALPTTKLKSTKKIIIRRDKTDKPCFLHTYDTNLQKARGLAEIILVIWALMYLLSCVREATFVPFKIFIENMQLCPSRVFLPHCFEDVLAIIAMLFTGFYFLFFCRGFKLTGPFVIMIYRMLASDLLRFGTIYFIFVMGFSQAFYIIFQSYDSSSSHPMPSPIESIIAIFLMSLGSFGTIWNSLISTDHTLLGKFHCFVFIAIVVVLLVNLLIAMMGDTYTKIAEIKNEWMRQWARTVLIVERGISSKERLRNQNIYSERMSTGKKAMVMKQTMSEDQLEEIKDIIEMKVSHRRNINRRRDKFGYESDSLIGLDLADANVIAPDAAEDEENPYS
ncbi:TRPV5 [Lepeophtheirus salmonis]|uniref:TRPV5 n=1 Tax=Lepeophtheirus salmonis TaxID=72036 RepID=A0A7R8H0S9_LEPSM|nr:TRPV5 [Lepeophtheirus salmonis]CAF2774996.1 TRPV5 [Lepeophtheirus salmonis]